MALTESPGSQPPKKTQAPGGCSFKGYIRELLISLQVFGTFLSRKQHDDPLTCETENHNFTRWVNAHVIANNIGLNWMSCCLF